jgi:hypothetical protein
MIPRASMLVALTAIGLSAGFAACSSSDTTNPNPTPVTASASSGDATASASSTSGGMGGAGGGAGATTTSSTGTGAGGAGGGSDCFGGTPKTNVELLNACTSADCGKFTTALPLLKTDGTLPPLP